MEEIQKKQEDQSGYRLTASLLSFLLPGLGQLYRGQWFRALLFFGVFIAFLSQPKARWGVLILLLLASFDALSARRLGVVRKDRIRTVCFVSLGFLAFLFWFLLLNPFASRLQTQVAQNDRATWVAERMERCRTKTGHLPQTLADCLSPKELARAVDPWGTPYSYEPSGRGFTLRSDGPDKTPHTNDDYLYHFR